MHIADPQPVNAPVITRGWIVDEDGVQMLQADFDDWQVVVYQHSRSQPILSLMGRDISEVLFDDPVMPWPPSQRGYNFQHRVIYQGDYDGQLYVPTVGDPVVFEYQLNRNGGRGPLLWTKVQPVVDRRSANYQP